ncbi:MAG: hypothetical protein AAGF79_01255 [Pseudomonadota bacterium]
MTRSAALAAFSLLLFVPTAAIAQAQKAETLRPPASYTGQWFTAANGCSYSRAQAPGYPVTWHLIQNPHHIGKQNASRRCPSML